MLPQYCWRVEARQRCTFNQHHDAQRYRVIPADVRLWFLNFYHDARWKHASDKAAGTMCGLTGNGRDSDGHDQATQHLRIADQHDVEICGSQGS